MTTNVIQEGTPVHNKAKILAFTWIDFIIPVPTLGKLNHLAATQSFNLNSTCNIHIIIISNSGKKAPGFLSKYFGRNGT